MKMINLITVISFAMLMVMAGIVGLLQKRYELLALACLFGAISRIAYIDYKDIRMR